MRNISDEDIENVFRTFTSLTIHESGGCTYSDGLIGVAVAFDTLTIVTVFYVFDVTCDPRYKLFKREHYRKLREVLIGYKNRNLSQVEVSRVFDDILSDKN